jgi:pimeloyl-ACP methyl ester carboxylesterase
MSVRQRGVVAAVLVATAVALGGCSDRADGGVDRRVTALRFGPCADLVDLTSVPIGSIRLGRLEVGCATLQVPLDHARPDGERIGMKVVRIRSAERAGVIGSLVLNPGGPGQSGLAFMPGWLSWFSDGLLQRFDLVTFDPRGVAASGAISCGPLPEDTRPASLPDVRTAAGFAVAATANQHLADACAAGLGDRTPFFTTEATARDVDLLRQALGDDKLTYVGFSYGAKLGSAYAHRFPDRVRALVLDAPSDPQADPVAIVESQVASFERSFTAYSKECPQRLSCGAIGDPRSFLPRLVARAETAPIGSGRAGDDLPATGADILTAVTGLLYDDAAWPHLDEVLAEAAAGDSGSAFEAIDNLFGPDGPDADTRPDASDAQFVINCNDAPGRPAVEQIRPAAVRLEAASPIFGRFGSSWLLGCTHWHHGPLDSGAALERPTAPTAPPILVVGTVGDPVTPYSGAVSLTRTLGGAATLLTWEGEGHTAFGQSPCINRLVDAYLISLTLPPAGTRCRR